jgi:restriction endonuclease Mrr
MFNQCQLWLQQFLTKRRGKRWLRMRCPHGMPGGLTRQLCAECAVEAYQKAQAEAARYAEERQRQQEAAERQRRAELRRQQEEDDRRRHRAEEEHRARLQQQAVQLREQELAHARAILLQSLTSLLQLTPRDFERVVAELYNRLGYQVELTPATGDMGVDIVATKDRQRCAIECKRFMPTQPVSRPLLQKLHSAMHVINAQKGIFVTTSRFSAQAHAFGAQWNIELVDGKELCRLFATAFPINSRHEHFHVICTECGIVLRFPIRDKLMRAKCPNGHVVYCDSRVFVEKLF